jgi:hypothetical protein
MLTLLAGTGNMLRAAIVLQDGSTRIFTGTTVGVSVPFTVTAGANVMVVSLSDHYGTTEFVDPSTISYGSQILTRLVTTNAGGPYRNTTIYYLTNPAPATATISATLSAGLTSWYLQAYTLNGVNTGTNPLVGAYSSGSAGVASISTTVANVPANAWAVVNVANANANGTNTITATSGTVVAVESWGDACDMGMGYVSGLSAGVNSFTTTNNDSSPQKYNMVVAVFAPPAMPSLAITSINGGANPTAGIPFSVVVQAQDAAGNLTNVTANTSVTISRTTGTGTLGGTLTGTILAGTSSVTINGVTYTKAESGVTLTATRTSGDTLAAGNSAAFTVTSAAATALVLTSGNGQSRGVGRALLNPFVVTVTDIYGNPVSGRGVTFAITTVPAGATGQALSATSTATVANGQASSTLTLGSMIGTYTVTATSAGLSGSPTTFTATASAITGNYTPLTSATYEYQICFKCHTGYSWGATPPNGNSPNGTATSPIMTDVAQEFSPMNLSGHPITTGLNNYPNSKSPKALGTAQLKAPWNVNVGTQTMMCSDCHDATTASAVQGPHGSASPFMLRVFSGGPAPTTWPTATAFNSSWCYNCHNDLSISMGGHANHHSAGGCNVCHVVIPHGSKMSRLMADQDGSMPARYALNSSKTTSTVKITSFNKSTGGNYSENGACQVNCGHHSSGSNANMENW